MAEYRYSLEKYGGRETRFTCPECGKPHQFARYVDNDTGEYIHESIGLCNRRDKCGYHRPPRDYFKTNSSPLAKENFQSIEKVEEIKTHYVPVELMEKTLLGWSDTNLGKILIKWYFYELAYAVCTSYLLGQATRDNRTACIFWQVDYNGKIRTGKNMCYDLLTGKRRKEEGFAPSWIHNSTLLRQPFNLKQCIFGEQFLKKFPNKPVMIVESEKTAMVASAYMPEYIWLATGGVTGVKWTEFGVHKVLMNRRVILFPDFGFYNKAKNITCYDKWIEVADHIRERMPCDISVSRLLEDNVSEENRVQGYDLADFLIRVDDKTGLAVDENGVPIKDLIPPAEWFRRFNNVQ